MKKRSRLEPKISSFPTAIAANAGVIFGLNQALENVPDSVDNLAYLAAGAALIPLNKYVILPLADGINQRIKGFKSKVGYNTAAVTAVALLAFGIYDQAINQDRTPESVCNSEAIREFQGLPVYEPFSPEARNLFRQAAQCANVPEEWADLDSLHRILQAESGGRVGIPNYTILDAQTNRPASENPAIWPGIHEIMRAGYDALERALFEEGSLIRTNQSTANYSSASGLGQLLIRRADEFYPSGREGIGNTLEEAIGMLRYIQSAHGTPEQAWRNYNRYGEVLNER